MAEKRENKRELVFGVEAIAKVSSAPNKEFIVQITNFCANGLAFTPKHVAPKIAKGNYITFLFNKDEPHEMQCLCEVMHIDGIYYGCRQEATQIKRPVES